MFFYWNLEFVHRKAFNFVFLNILIVKHMDRKIIGPSTRQLILTFLLNGHFVKLTFRYYVGIFLKLSTLIKESFDDIGQWLMRFKQRFTIAQISENKGVD